MTCVEQDQPTLRDLRSQGKQQKGLLIIHLVSRVTLKPV